MLNLNHRPFLVVGAALLASAAHAQVPAALPSAGSLQSQSARTLEYLDAQRRLRQEEEKRDAERSSPVVEQKRAAESATKLASPATLIPVSRIEVDKSEILSEAEIRALVAPYEGRPVAIGELFALTEAFNTLYAEKEFSTARALLPAQKIRDGVVRIQLAEGRIGAVILEGNGSTRDDFIKSRLFLHEGQLVNLNTLERDLTLFNGINDLSLRVELRPGKEFGTVDAILKAEEPQRNQLSASLDNTGRDSVGLERLGLTYVNASLFGFRDALTISSYLATGTQARAIAYSVPLGPYGTRLGAGYDWSEIKVRNGDFRALDIGGKSTATTINLKHPVLVSPTTKVEAFVSAQEKRAETTFSGVDIAHLTVRSGAVGFTGQRFDEDGVWQTSHTLTGGEERYSGQTFTRYNGDFARLVRFSDDKVATFRGNAQWSSRKSLPSTEQYQLGGLASVRGYPEGLLAGDKGYFLSAELGFPLRLNSMDPASDLFGGQLRGTVFFDHGGAFPFKGNGQGSNSQDYLTSLGFGALLNFSKTLSGRIEVGVPLAERRGESSPRLHFTLQSRLF